MADLSFNIYNLLILAGCIQGFMLSLLLVRNNALIKRKSNVYMAIAIVSFSISNVHQVLIDASIGKESVSLFFFMPLSWGLLTPFSFYLFVQYLIYPDYKPGRKYFWMLAPFVLHLCSQIIVFYLFLSRSPVLFKNFKEYNIILVIGTEIFSILYSLIILYFLAIDVASYKMKLKEKFSNLSNKSLAWLRNLLIALSAVWVLWSVPYLYEVITNQFLQWHHYPLWISMSIIIYWIGYSVLSRTEIFQSTNFSQPEESSEKFTSKLSDKTEEHFSRLMLEMKSQKPFLNPELSLELLAKEVDLSAGYLSQIINKKGKASFYDFINKYRVEEAKKILSNSEFDHYSIEAIGMEAGFNSKSTFNTAFKKHSGRTPSEFKKQRNPVSR